MEVTGERDTAWREAENLRRRTEGFDQVRRDVERTIARLRRFVQDMNRRRGARDRECRDIETRTRFAVRYATRIMVCDVWQRSDDICALLDRHTGNIFAGQTVDE